MSSLRENKTGLFWFFLGTTFVLWGYSFWAFLSRDVQMVSDAVSFYDHLKFYIDNIILGVYPYWDPSWSCGSPNEFFLRRIGPFNPFLLLISIPYKLGLPYWAAFAGFITFYFFLGMAGFYKLTLEILKDQRMAIVAFVLLSFSSLGTRVFDSYIMMILTPVIWFFYFGFVFGRLGRKSSFLGMVFCAMLLLTTYVPFYFLVLVLSFAVFFIPVFPKESKGFFLNLKDFIVREKWLFLFCVAAIGLASWPGVAFFQSASQGIFSMPLRHFNGPDPHMLTVKPDVTSYWAIPEELLFASFYVTDLRLFDFAVFYVPLFAVILFFLGAVTSVNRKTFFILLWGLFFVAMGSPYGVGLYEFLYKHIFFFKYFRNLHFFLWLVILPLLIILVVEQLRLLLNMIDESRTRKSWWLFYIIAVHLAIGGLLYWQQNVNFSTWAVLGLSFVFFIAYTCRWLSSSMICGFCFLVIVMQPVEAYQNLQRNAYKTNELSYYDYFSPEFQYTRGQKEPLIWDFENSGRNPVEKNKPIYFGTGWYNLLWNNVYSKVIKNYTHAKFVLYDNVAAFDERGRNWDLVSQAWTKNLNLAFLPQETALEKENHPVSGFSSSALIIEKGDQQLRVTDFDTNRVKLKTDLLTRKFLVFNDCYYPGWRAYVNGKEVKLYRANVAFKGIWVPAGKHDVEFVFVSGWRYWMEPALVVFYFVFFVLMLWYLKNDFNFCKASND